MKFLSLALTLAAATLGLADNTITFVSQDSVDRTVHFTPNPGMPDIKAVEVAGKKNATVDIPHGWIGNFFSISKGKDVVPGMLGEVAFNSWGGITFFDVSAIVDPNDHVGVKQMWPSSDRKPTSGCDLFPCAFAYYLPDDIQTQATKETDLICTLGGDSATIGVDQRDIQDDGAAVFSRDFVVGRGLPVRL